MQKSEKMTKAEIIDQIFDHERSIHDMKEKLDRHEKLLHILIAKKFDFREALESRGFTTNESEIKRLIGIAKDYNKLKSDEIDVVLDYMRKVNQTEKISNFPGFFQAEMRKRYWVKHRDYTGITELIGGDRDS